MAHLKSQQISLGQIEKAGLILAKEAGGYYDRFRNRIVFPIADIQSRVIAFGAREIPEEVQKPQARQMPKYLNSPETPLYVKGRNLYGLNLAKDAIRQQDCAVVVEGYLDLIIPYQEGIHNIVASLGTALTTEQIRLIRRFTHNVVMVYDADNAGQIATLRSLDMFLEEAMNVRVVSLPHGHDPDSFVRKFGSHAFKEKIAFADTLFDYKIKLLKSQYPLKDAESKAKISSVMLPTIGKCKDAILSSEYTKRLAQELEVKEEVLLQELGRIKTDTQEHCVSSEQFQREKTTSMHPTEQLLIKLMLEESRLIAHIKENISPDDFQDNRIGKIVSLLFECIDQGKPIDPKCLLSQLDDQADLKCVCESAFLPDILQEDKEKVVQECITRLKHRRLTGKKEFLHKEIKRAQESKDEERLHSLMHEFHQLTKKR